jgi:hypothetical protein
MTAGDIIRTADATRAPPIIAGHTASGDRPRSVALSASAQQPGGQTCLRGIEEITIVDPSRLRDLTGRPILVEYSSIDVCAERVHRVWRETTSSARAGDSAPASGLACDMPARPFAGAP